MIKKVDIPGVNGMVLFALEFFLNGFSLRPVGFHDKWLRERLWQFESFSTFEKLTGNEFFVNAYFGAPHEV